MKQYLCAEAFNFIKKLFVAVGITELCSAGRDDKRSLSSSIKTAILASSKRGNPIKFRHIKLSADSLKTATLYTLMAFAIISFNKESLAAAKSLGDFTESSQCQECHQQEYADWQQSDHRKAMQPASENTVLGDFNNVTVNFHGIETPVPARRQLHGGHRGSGR